MNSARIVVIDEDRDEGLMLLSALGKAGIGSMYFKGDDQDQLPPEPLSGIRVVFLDLKLLPRDEPDEYIPFTVEVLLKTVVIEPSVTGIICWTKQESDIEIVQQELEKRGVQPAFLSHIENKLKLLEKADCDPVLAEITKISEPMTGRNLITSWETIVHNATSTSTASLLKLAENDDELLRILAAVARGAAEDRIQGGPEAIEALQAGLVAIQSDEIENHIGQIDGGLSEALYRGVSQLRKTPLTIEQRSHLNRALLTTTAIRPQPGNVYLPSGWEPQDEFPHSMKDSEVRGLVREFFTTKQNDDVFIRAVADKAIPCLVDLTPACDFAQGKTDHSRLVAGLLIESPGDEERERERQIPAACRIFAREVPFAQIENDDCGLNGSYKIIVNARMLVVESLENLTKHKVAFRLRNSIVTDIRAWLGSHVARPGYVAVH